MSRLLLHKRTLFSLSGAGTIGFDELFQGATGISALGLGNLGAGAASEALDELGSLLLHGEKRMEKRCLIVSARRHDCRQSVVTQRYGDTSSSQSHPVLLRWEFC